MHWYNDNVERLRQLPKPYYLLYVTAKVIGGVGIGVLLANWLDASTWWIFIVIAIVIAIPVIVRVICSANKDGFI